MLLLVALVSFTFHADVAIHFIREINPLKPYIKIKKLHKIYSAASLYNYECNYKLCYRTDSLIHAYI